MEATGETGSNVMREEAKRRQKEKVSLSFPGLLLPFIAASSSTCFTLLLLLPPAASSFLLLLLFLLLWPPLASRRGFSPAGSKAARSRTLTPPSPWPRWDEEKIQRKARGSRQGLPHLRPRAKDSLNLGKKQKPLDLLPIQSKQG